MHDFTGTRPSRTVHAPQLVVSQPICVPVSARSSRNTWTRSLRGSTSTVFAAPLTVNVTSIWCSSPAGQPSRPRPRGPAHEHVHHVALVVGGAANVGGGLRGLRREPADSANASSPGEAPASDDSAASARRFVRPTDVSPIPALPIEPFSRVRKIAAATVAKSPTLRSIFR